MRDLGAPLGSPYFSRRDELRANPSYARVVAAGPIVTVPGGYPTSRISCLTVSSPEDARHKVKQLVAGGADVIKIAVESGGGPTLSEAEIAAIVETAHESNIPVTVHYCLEVSLVKILLIEPAKAPITLGGEDFSIYEPLALEYVAAGVAQDHDVKILDLRLE